MPTFSYRLRSSDAHLQPNKPQYAFVNNAAAGNSSEAQQCFVRFDVPADLEPTVLLYYKLTNFFQNHRRYVKSVNTDQLRGKAVSFDDLKNSDCKPLATNGSIIIWPCGLIANSYFNGGFPSVSTYLCVLNIQHSLDTFSPSLTPVTDGGNFTFSEKGIAWPGEAKKYSSAPGYSDLSQIQPPPNWIQRFPNGYNESNLPNLHDDEHFHNWMRTAGLPTFTKLWGRNDNDKLLKGTYQITVNMSTWHLFSRSHPETYAFHKTTP